MYDTFVPRSINLNGMAPVLSTLSVGDCAVLAALKLISIMLPSVKVKSPVSVVTTLFAVP